MEQANNDWIEVCIENAKKDQSTKRQFANQEQY